MKVSVLSLLALPESSSYVHVGPGMLGVAHWGRFQHSQLRAAEIDVEVEVRVENEVGSAPAKGMPSKADFEAFFSQAIASPATEMGLDDFVKYAPVEDLLSSGLILEEDVNGLWISNVGDAAGLTASEGYEMLCMTMDLPDPDDLNFLEEAFASLSSIDSGKVTFMKFLGWSDIQDMINEEVITVEKVTYFWREVAGDLNAAVDRKGFNKINSLVDLFLDKDQGEGEGEGEGEGGQVENESDAATDVYAASFNPTGLQGDPPSHLRCESDGARVQTAQAD